MKHASYKLNKLLKNPLVNHMTYFDTKVKCEFIKPETKELLVVEPPKINLNSFECVKENKDKIEDYLVKFGRIFLRNFGIYSVSEFNKIVQTICLNLLDYVYRSTPRTKLGGKIYAVTEYPTNTSIPLHNKNSYSKFWPEKIFFFSVIVASKGGQTPIANSRNVYKGIGNSIKEKFEQHGILYVRNYTQGVDLSWQDVFQTDQKDVVNKYCQDNDINFEWNDIGSELTTKQVYKVSILHPTSGESVWFNQAYLFHISTLEENDCLLLIQELGEENLPRNIFYGDMQAAY